MTKQTTWLCAQRRLRSESSLCAQWVAKDPSFLHANREDWSLWADAQADLSLRWAHSHFVGFVMSGSNMVATRQHTFCRISVLASHV